MQDHSYASPRSRQAATRSNRSAIAASAVPRAAFGTLAASSPSPAPPSEERAAKIHEELQNMLGTPVLLPTTEALSPHIRPPEPLPDQPEQKRPVARVNVDLPITASFTAPARPATPPARGKETDIVKQVRRVRDSYAHSLSAFSSGF